MPLCGITETLSDVESVRVIHEKAKLKLTVYDLLKMHISDNLPVAYTGDIGHGHASFLQIYKR